MNVIEYLQGKYRIDKPTTMLKTEAEVFGIPYPLPSGWRSEFGGVRITDEMADGLRTALAERERCKPKPAKRSKASKAKKRKAAALPAVANTAATRTNGHTTREQARQATRVAQAPTKPAKTHLIEGVDVRSDEFLRTWAWRELRYATIRRYGAVCQCCGATPKTSGEPIQVDHIKPRSLFPELATDPENLQVLCGPCNQGKSNKDFTDWRSDDAPLDDQQRAHMAHIRGDL